MFSNCSGLRPPHQLETRTQNQDTQALAKEINQRLDGLLSRWLLLKNTGQDMATDNSTVPVLPTH
ncbi:hypothetical protein NKB04_004448 [Escherichia coli]|nr:hypothetical protein [Escherichia coli]EJH5038296.1 hypothetical protein [Escherichia coli O145:H28]EER3600560.1 hypothetical protein [Escherichia coli]EET3039762.1 hypothetical protein [Escherichia coli]EEX1642920.1 hypothetical protein [Escherichia coli]EEX3266709.1 hypothetical protein [Escherichia coli]